MKTLAAFSKPIEAHLLIARLAGNGVRSFIRDEHMVTLDWLASNAIGGVKVEVADDDLTAAQEVLSIGPLTDEGVDRGGPAAVPTSA